MKDNKPQVDVNISNRTILRVILVTVITLMGLAVIRAASHALTLIFTAVFLALALNPAVSWLNRKLRIKSRIAGAAIAYVLVLALLISFFSAVVPPLVKQTTEFVGNVPQTISDFQRRDSSLSRFVYRYNLDEELTQVGKELSNSARSARGKIFSTVSRIGGALISLITVLVLTFMMLVEGPLWLDRFWRLQPTSKREHRKHLARKMYGIVTGYVNGQLLISVIAASFALVVMLIVSSLLNAKINVVALSGIVALFGLIPLIGNTLAAFVVVLACALVSAPLAIIMAIYFVLYQQIENVTIQPYIQARKNELTALLVFLAALLGASFGGLLGAFVAIPAAGCIKILVEDYYSRRKAV